jgi:outer membrane lipoprotein SlyB
MLRRRSGMLDRVVQMAKAHRQLASILALAVIGCQQQAFRVGQQTSVRFGTVTNVEQVNLQSDVPAGALVGGTIGLIAGGGRNAPRNAILGAAVGAGATAVAQGNRTGIAYSVRMLDGSTIRIISDQSEIRVGDCVAIERAGDTNNIRREHPAYCASQNQAAVRAIQEQTQAAAAHCEAAKQELVSAATPEAVDLATAKVNLLCN